MKKVLASILLALVSVMSEASYVNFYDEEALMECRSNEVLSHIGSTHSNYHEDRRWEFECRPEGNIVSCSWSGYVNNYDELLAYSCPENKVLTGVRSIHHNHYEDRQFSFKCCAVHGKNTTDCYFTDFVNNWDQPLSVSSGIGYSIKGAASCHDNSKEDRRWKFLLCKLQ